MKYDSFLAGIFAVPRGRQGHYNGMCIGLFLCMLQDGRNLYPAVMALGLIPSRGDQVLITCRPGLEKLPAGSQSTSRTSPHLHDISVRVAVGCGSRWFSDISIADSSGVNAAEPIRTNTDVRYSWRRSFDGSLG